MRERWCWVRMAGSDTSNQYMLKEMGLSISQYPVEAVKGRWSTWYISKFHLM